MGKDKSKSMDVEPEIDIDPPNFYCRRNPTIPRQDPPRPYAFLQRILSEHRIRTDDVEPYSGVEDLATSLTGLNNVSVNNPSESVALQAGAGAIAAVQNGLNLRETANTLADTSGSTELGEDHMSSSTASLGQAGASEKVEAEQELPWFSQLSAYPQLRSAGIPLVPDDATCNKLGGFNAAANKKRTAAALASASLINISGSSSRPGPSSSSSSALLNSSSAPLSLVTSPKASSTATMDNFHRSDSSTSLCDAVSRAHKTNASNLTVPLTSSISSTGSTASNTSARPSPPEPKTHANSTPLSTTTTATIINNFPSAAPRTNNSLSSLPLASNTSTSASNNNLVDFQEDLLPPDNFAMVNSHVYRCSFPKKKHFPFLRTLGLRSVLTLILEEYPETNSNFLDQNGITFFQFGIPGNKEPFVSIPTDKITAALTTILDRRNHPILIHCNKGKHRTGCLIGCLRKLQQWSLTTIFDEYRRFSWPKSRSMDQEFIELYDETAVWRDINVRWLPKWSVLPLASLKVHNFSMRAVEDLEDEIDGVNHAYVNHGAEEDAGLDGFIDSLTIWRGM
ncbi:related to SIW14 - protein involved in actin filament organization [Melanopsichium pennsylvanicum]|uniref:diphosphoinositol-polyphosphate diphosphatase n=2 Tax=Melanopsichium pennsylvanicum TaxID=63383 RepID=A0AAJ4XP19_9BASI|nr:related to SIW14-protein involved in actin filament organization [Melanopsichium pennsylvanicum 4]SNX85747.1 related to SIW14 - protein involved in actin filament organization [Melanopsichium pennsylvanicum]